ncbi:MULTISPECIES: ABC transporter permease subunit [Vibrio]|jgi:cationic peptide transport system permease protein|uniref:Peptide ABC transporter permease n=1 Tax=Vibrio natriegens NBRC 15636 = ATCC 14048 = DSM 759 TaxID=1219067 RepID=A0AAN0Y1X4_VIBNA|nr:MULTISPECIES: ABC transporter permease subunit [Vibrio]MEE3878234.1 ABC transporter permease subunit [Vibrio sp. YYF0003]WMN88327.1 ABC transporter permease subunit [Vibrio parahaemolyticus]CAH0529402.1 Peptide transport system permease protein SapC [Catenococcus thiocycli]AEX21634.1 peptide ABC transporter permease [Vibrio sp. EJY3]ALR15872.1 peptide ABC transporter permease [Vibrio natriegens NBRC 15636 = ATCC 14048 = DSM 759]
MLTNNVYQEEHIPTQFERFWRSYRANGLAMFGLWCLTFIVLITLFAPLIAPFDPQAQSGELLVPPSWSPSGSVDYFLGTDDLGRDILSRLIIGSQLTFGAAVGITVTAAIIGCLIGVLAGMTKGLLSSTLNHLLDTVMSIPSLLLAIIFVAFLGFGEFNILLAICLALIPRFIRSVYIAVHTEVEKDYIMAARLDGANDFYLLWSSILPNVLTVIAAEFTLALSTAILDITALGFLGLGAQAPSTEWGAILGDSVELIYIAPWTVTLPGLTIMFTVITLNLVGEGVRRSLNAGIE